MSDKIELPVEAADLLIQMKNQIDHTAITPEVFKLYAQRANETKEKIDRLAAEIHQRQDKMRLINDLICDINNLTDDKHELNLSQNLDLQEKLRIAKELGANINAEKLTYSPVERDRLLQNLNLKAEEWDKTNRTETQKMEIHVKELDRIMMLIKEVQKGEDRPKRSATAGMKGG